MFKMKPVYRNQEVNLLTLLVCIFVIFVNFYYLLDLKSKVNNKAVEYKGILSEKSHSNELDEYVDLDYFEQINEIMYKKGEGIFIEKISLSDKHLLIWGMANSVDQINVFKGNIGNKFLLKNVTKHDDQYSFELESVYE